jgi:putative virulence related protein PagC
MEQYAYRKDHIVKKAMIALVASLAFAGTAFAAAPVMNMNAGQFQIGYTYSNLKGNQSSIGDLGTFQGNDFQLVYGLGNNYALTGNFLDTNSQDVAGMTGLKLNTAEIGLQYQLSRNFAVSTGNVNSKLSWDQGSVSTNDIYGGIAYRENLADNLDGYASYLRSSAVEDFKCGVVYGLDSNTSFDVGYRYNENDSVGTTTFKGMSFGLNHRF